MSRALLLALLLPGLLSAAVRVEAPPGLADPVVKAILAGPTLPADIFAVRRQLQTRGGDLRTFVLANRGHHNPGLGSFTFFEAYRELKKGGKVVEGELFLGFFTGTEDGALRVLTGGGLLIELVAWDSTKEVFNFWELVVVDKDRVWRYVGDSHDILADVAEANLGGARPVLGRRIRCAACHTLGGPVMKEISAPHNDWVTRRNRPHLGGVVLRPGKNINNPFHLAAELMAAPADASHFAQLVEQGIDRLLSARAKRGGDGQSVRQQLRPLFTTMEINLATDDTPLARRRADGQPVELPAGFFVDERLSGPVGGVGVAVRDYEAALKKLRSKFAPGEADALDSYHAFSVPVRSAMDNRVLDSLVRQGLLDEGLIAAVLAVDFTTPIFSPARARLLRYVPEKARDAADLRKQLIANLRAAKGDEAARELLANLTDPKRTPAFHRGRAREYLKAVRASSPEAVAEWLKLAAQRRKEVLEADTARHSGGNVLEAGFKVLFPELAVEVRPGRWRLDAKTGRVVE